MWIANKKFEEWDVNIRKRLFYATFPDGFIRKSLKFNPDIDTFVAFGRHYIMGWATIFKAPDEIMVNIFVNRRFRNRGVAKALVKEIIKKYPRIVLMEWNRLTKYLFSQLQRQYPKNISVKEWYPNNIKKYYRLIGIKRPS